MQIAGVSNQAVNPLQRQVERDRRDPAAEPAGVKTNREQSQQQQSLRESTQSAQTAPNSAATGVSFDPAVILSSQRVEAAANIEKPQTQRVRDEERLPRQNQVAAKAYENTQNYSVAQRKGYGELAGIDVIV